MAEAYEVFYYADRGRNRQGPLAEADIVRLIDNGTIERDTLIWSAELTDWREAGQVEKFAALFAPHAPPPGFYEAGSPIGAAMRVGNLSANFPVWGLFWRSVLAVLGNLVVIPAPWVATTYHRFIGTHTMLPDGRRFTFAGQPGDIWLVFVGIGVLGLAARFSDYAIWIAEPLSLALSVLVMRWFCAKLGTEDGSVKLTFVGGFWAYIGWNILLALSFLTIIGWAWVMKALMRWVCQNVRGTLAFDFTGSGGAILWRSLVVTLASIFVIPIPWMLRWYAVWLVSQIQVSQQRA